MPRDYVIRFTGRETLASLRHHHTLAYGCEPFPSWASDRRRNRIPIGRDEMINSREKRQES